MNILGKTGKVSFRLQFHEKNQIQLKQLQIEIDFTGKKIKNTNERDWLFPHSTVLQIDTTISGLKF